MIFFLEETKPCNPIACSLGFVAVDDNDDTLDLVYIPDWYFNQQFSEFRALVQYKGASIGNVTTVRSSYLQNGTSYTGKMASLY